MEHWAHRDCNGIVKEAPFYLQTSFRNTQLAVPESALCSGEFRERTCRQNRSMQIFVIFLTGLATLQSLSTQSVTDYIRKIRKLLSFCSQLWWTWRAWVHDLICVAAQGLFAAVDWRDKRRDGPYEGGEMLISDTSPRRRSIMFEVTLKVLRCMRAFGVYNGDLKLKGLYYISDPECAKHYWPSTLHKCRKQHLKYVITWYCTGE